MTARASTGLDRVTSIAMVLFTGILTSVSCQQSEILESQRQIQAAATRSNVAPSYGGESTEKKLILNMENTGGIPAREVSVSESRRVLASREELADLCKSARPAGYPLTLHPGSTIEHHLPALTDDDVKEMELAGRRYYVCGAIRFRDELGEAAPSDFCFSFGQEELTDAAKKNLDHTICTPPNPGQQRIALALTPSTPADRRGAPAGRPAPVREARGGPPPGARR